MWRQWESSNTNAGIVMGFTDGLQNRSPGVNLTDQHGEGLHTSAILGWNYRIGDLPPAPAKTISYLALGSTGGGAARDSQDKHNAHETAQRTSVPLPNHTTAITHCR